VLYHPFFGGKKPVAPKKPLGACEADPALARVPANNRPPPPDPRFPVPTQQEKQTKKTKKQSQEKAGITLLGCRR